MDKIIIRINGAGVWVVIKFMIIIIFGIKPKKGGRPPRESIFIKIINFRELGMLEMCMLRGDLILVREKIIANKIKVYDRKNSTNKLKFNNVAMIIQVALEIEEYAKIFFKEF